MFLLEEKKVFIYYILINNIYIIKIKINNNKKNI